MLNRFSFFSKGFAVAAILALVSADTVSAQAVGDIRVEVVNEGNSDFGFAPVWFGFHNGSFDTFDIGGTAAAGLEDIAEIGNATVFNGEFAAGPGTPGNIQGVVAGPGPIPTGTSATGFVTPLNPANYQYLNVAGMLLASNDLFFGNENPLAYQVFDSTGAINDSSGVFEIAVFSNSIYDAGTEVDDASLSGGAAGLVGAVATAGADENGVVTLATQSDLDTFNGAQLGFGGVLNDTDFGAGRVATIRVSLVTVPEPGSMLLVAAIGGIATVRRRRR